MEKIYLPALVATLAFFSPGLAGASRLAPHVKGEMLVRFADQAVLSTQVWTEALSAIEAQDVGALSVDMPGLHKVILAEGMDLETAIARVSTVDGVQYAQPNYIYTIKAVVDPTDKNFKDQWALKNTGQRFGFGKEDLPGLKGFDIKAQEAWEAAGGADKAANVVVAVIDTGVDFTHSDLNGNIWKNAAENGAWTPANAEEARSATIPGCRDKSCNGVDDDSNGFKDDYIGWNWAIDRPGVIAKGTNNPRDLHGHGTHVSGVIGSLHNGKGTVGINSKVQIMALRFLNKEGSGTDEGAILAINYASKMGADLINASWGGGGESPALNEAVQASTKAGTLFVAAAGNSSMNNDYSDNWPANFAGVLSVAASDPTGKLAFFSNTGKRTVHIVAPGHVIMSTITAGKYAAMSGTSMATPQVVGVAALVLGVDPSLKGKPAALRARLINTSDIQLKFINRVSGNGHLNAYNAVKNIVPAGHQRPDASRNFGAIRLNPLESAHPYANEVTNEQTVSSPGAKWLRIKFGRYSMETNKDFVAVYDGQGNLYDMVTGLGRDGYTVPIKGDTAKLVFQSDRSVRGWGFEITGYETIE